MSFVAVILVATFPAIVEEPIELMVEVCVSRVAAMSTLTLLANVDNTVELTVKRCNS